ncbi:hypothetical protein [Advenella sp. FME57]|uniref:hypothetical protein n=1 Tax=Advenella sp. FME57 TaxID=2742604 RepID=UPI001867C9F5|nr:hypothetical protein [Advenella sp. FME57]
MALRVSQADPIATSERWEDYDHETSFKLAGLDNEEYQLGLERARRLVAKQDAGQTLKNLTISENDQREYQTQCKLVGAYIIRDWKGEIYDENDKLMPYTPENAQKLLLVNVALFAWIILKAKEVQIAQQAEEAETVGKSSRALSGNVNGRAARKSKRSSTKVST